MPYANIKIEEMRELLKADKGWLETIESGNEYVFNYPLKKKNTIVIKVWSSIHDMKDMKLGQFNAIAAKRGGDSIKVCAVDVGMNRGVRKTPHINRMDGWQGRVKDRVVELLKDLGEIS